ncbi:MAG: PIG-L family deacetylase [Anaerolineae bacterium]|jgi:LmbE family N-acetylglucosaminyl deacetylase
MRHLYLSPHLDDAVLSCGGAIHQYAASGARVEVLTLFAGEFTGHEISPFALLQHQYWGNPPRPMLLRRTEDSAALALLGAEAQHLDYLDAVYRAGPDGSWLYPQEEALWEGVHPADPVAQHGAQALAEKLVALLPARDRAIIYAPLAAGCHVDHQIVHAAARNLLSQGYRVTFYEDYPYAERPGATESAGGTEVWRVEVIPLSPAALAAKVSALGYYHTQMAVLFGGAAAMPNRIWAFAASRSQQTPLAEKLWWPAEA